MDELNGFPDGLNEWSKQNFDMAAKMFGRIVNRNQADSTGHPVSPVGMPSTSRENVIGKDDLTNLQILLGQAQSVDDFIKNM